MAIPENYGAFTKTLTDIGPTTDWPEALRALWYDAKSDWGASHDIAQEMHNNLGSWIHGYLHRREGDDFNARYWYRKADRDFPKLSLAQEHREITEFVLGAQP